MVIEFPSYVESERIEQLEEQVKALKEALKFYANEDVWYKTKYEGISEFYGDWGDGPKRAREALAKCDQI